MSDPILIARGLHKSYGEVHAVRGVDLEVARGEPFGLLGPNGAGKTTTIAMLVGLLAPARGEVLLDGEHLTSNARGLEARIGLVPQKLALYPTLSARDNLLFFGRIYGLRGRRLRRREEEDCQRRPVHRMWQLIRKLIRIPETDDCGEPTAGHAWRVYLYGHSPFRHGLRWRCIIGAKAFDLRNVHGE